MSETPSVQTLGKYQVRSVIGRGAMGTVLEAWDPVIDRRVAIKTVKLPGAQDAEMEEELLRFRREAQAAGRLSHPNIVGVYDYGETDDLAYIVMEFVDGQSVKAALDGQQRFAPAAIQRLMTDLLSGLEYSHGAGVIHRDIKPANLMLTKSGQAKIADFGIARIESSSMTQAGTVLGTPAYMSPEQFRGETVDLRTDVYSSGVLLYQLLTGERPFEGNLSSIMHKALTIEPPPPSVLSSAAPTALDAVVARAMAKRPDDRFASAAAFMAAIDAAMAAPIAAADTDATVFARPVPPPLAAEAPPKQVPPKSSKLPLLLGGGAVVAAAAVAAVFFLNQPSQPTRLAGTTPPPAATTPAATTPTTTPPAATPPAATTPALPAPAQSASVAPLPAPSASQPPVEDSPFTKPAPEPTPEPAPRAVVPATEAPPAQALIAPPPPLTTDAIRQRVAAALAGRPCTAVTGELNASSQAVLHGFTAAGGLARLVQAVTDAGAAVPDPGALAEADPSYCPALTAIAPILPPFGSPQSHVTLREASDAASLADGEYIRPRVQAPDYPSNLLVDYYSHDGTVEHIYPRLADAAHKIAGDPGQVLPPGETLSLGDPSSRHATFQVGPPYGRDMIVVVASSQPLFGPGRPHTGEQSAAYARDLRTAIDQARSHGVRLSADVIKLDTVAH